MYQRPGFYFPRLSDTPAVMGLILGCAIFFVLEFVGRAANIGLSLFNTYAWAISPYWFQSLHLWQPFTYPFVHEDFIGLLVDALVLYFFAGSLERAWGVRRFLIFFFGSAVLVGLVVMAAGVLTYGARFAAVLAGLGEGIWLTTIVAFATLNPYATILIMFVIPLQARWLAWITIAMEIFAGYSGYGGPLQAVVCVAVLSGFAYAFTSRNFRARVGGRRFSAGPSLKERFDRWQQRRRMRKWQKRVSKIDRPEDLFRDK